MIRPLPPIETLQAALDYDRETGELRFRARPEARSSWNTRHAGKPALSTRSPDGYLRGYLFCKMTLAHRVAYALASGSTDFEFVDHINGNRSDNRACNLRAVSRKMNAQNKARPSNSTTGHIGVSRTYDNRFRAHITVANKMVNLGRFERIEDAIAARAEGEAKFGFHENHGRPLVGAAA